MGWYDSLSEEQKDRYDSAKAAYDVYKYHQKHNSELPHEKGMFRRLARGEKQTMAQLKSGATKANIFGKLDKGMEGASIALKMFNAADKTIGAITEMIPKFAIDQVNQNAADRAGFGSANKLQSVVNQLGVGKLFSAVGGERLGQSVESVYNNQVGSGFTGSAQDLNVAKEFSNKKLAFGLEKARSFQNTSNAQQSAISRIGMESELAKQNSAGELYQMQNFNTYQGYSPSLLLKSGGVVSELESMRNMLKTLSKKDISKYQLGGKIIDPSKNIIPDGALHKNLNHLSEKNNELTDQITPKGIPVVSENEDGTITQHAEVEVGEVIFNLANTKIIEDY
jgi:hypothetical protein